MKKMGIRKTGLLVNSTIIIDSLYKLTKKLEGYNWMVTGNVATQLWIYYLAGNCVYCRPTDNLDIVGIDVIKPVEELYGVIAEGFEGDRVRRLSFPISHNPKFKINIESYSTPMFIDELERKKIIPFQKMQVPVIGMEDQIVSKIVLGRKQDLIDITGLLRAYKRYLRANIIKNLQPTITLQFSTIKTIIESTYPDMKNEIIETFENLSGAPINLLAEIEKSPRKLINSLETI